MATYLGTRRLADGTTVHRAIVRRKGAPPRVFQAPTKSKTRPTDGTAPAKGCMELAADYEAEIRAGRVRAGKVTVGDALDVYLKSDDFDGLEDATRREAMVGWWKERLGKLPLANLDEVHDAITEARDSLKLTGPSGRAVSASTRNRYLACLSKAFKVARKEKTVYRNLLKYNPALEIGRTSEKGTGRTRILEDAEFWTLLDACKATGDRRLPVLYLCALSSAARKSELLSLRRNELNLGKGVCPVWRTKSGHPRSLTFCGLALDALGEYVREQPPHVSGSLFAGPWGDPTFPRKSWNKALKAAGLKGEIVWHSLRHTSCTWAAILRYTEAERMVHSGHRTSSQLERYTHLAKNRESEVAGLLIEDLAATARKREVKR